MYIILKCYHIPLNTPGLFKVVWSGDGFAGLCSKMYYCAFLEVLTNRHSTVLTYVQERAALTYFYAKRVVHEDGVSTGPVDV